MKESTNYNAKLGTGAFDPIDTLALRAAVKLGQETFKLQSGKQMSIEYRSRHIFYKPLDGTLTPCGEVDIVRLLSPY